MVKSSYCNPYERSWWLVFDTMKTERKEDLEYSLEEVEA